MSRRFWWRAEPRSIGGIEQANYIVVRNHILALWCENVNIWLHRDHAMESMRSMHKSLVNSSYIIFAQVYKFWGFYGDQRGYAAGGDECECGAPQIGRSLLL